MSEALEAEMCRLAAEAAGADLSPDDVTDMAQQFYDWIHQ